MRTQDMARNWQPLTLSAPALSPLCRGGERRWGDAGWFSSLAC